MYVSAQRVFSPASGQRGVNVFAYDHGGYTWETAAPEEMLPDRNPGELVWQDLQLRPPGNRVLSFLDIVAPDEMSDDELLGRLAVLKRVLPEGEGPVFRWNPLWIRFGLYAPLPWRTELGALAGHLVLRLPHGWRG